MDWTPSKVLIASGRPSYTAKFQRWLDNEWIDAINH